MSQQVGFKPYFRSGDTLHPLNAPSQQRPLYYGRASLAPAPDQFSPRHDPQFGGLFVRKNGTRRDLGIVSRLVLSTILAAGGFTAATGQTYIREGRAPTPREFLTDNFMRTSEGVRITHLEPAPPYNNTDNLPPTKYNYVESDEPERFADAERIATNRIREILSGRPDLLHALENLPTGLEIKIYDVPSIYDMSRDTDLRPEHLKRDCPDDVDGRELSLRELREQCPLKPPERSAGYVSSNEYTQQVVLGLTINYLERMFANTDDGYEIIAHEVGGHLIDSLALHGGRAYVVGTDGMLPGLTERQETLFRYGRLRMKENVANGESILRAYSLKNDNEFLSVAVEAFFERPEDLKAESPEMHQVLSEFFNVDPDNLPSADGPSLFAQYRENTPPAVISALILGGSLILVFGGHAIWVRLPVKRKEGDDGDGGSKKKAA